MYIRKKRNKNLNFSMKYMRCTASYQLTHAGLEPRLWVQKCQTYVITWENGLPKFLEETFIL